LTPERRAFFIRAAPPLLVGALIARFPVREGLKPQAWYYFALFAAVIVGVATYAGTLLATPGSGFTGTTLAAARFDEIDLHTHTVPGLS